MGITLDKLVFDTSVPDNGANVGAYLRASDGTLITHTSGALNVRAAGTFAEDSAHSSGDLGVQMLAVRNDAGTSLVSADGDYSPFSLDANGALRVSGSFTPGDNKNEDAAHSSGDTGSYILSVRQDVLASSTSADGDYQSFKTDALGRLRNSNAKQSGVYAAVSVGNTATDIIGTDLANRTSVIIQNVSNRDVFLGLDNSVTTSNGIRLAAGASIEVEAGPALNWHGITSSGTADVRYLELV